MAESTRERAEAARAAAVARVVSAERDRARLFGGYLRAFERGAITGFTGMCAPGSVCGDVGPPEDVFLMDVLHRAERDLALREARSIERYLRRAASACRAGRAAWQAAVRRARMEADPEPPPRKHDSRPGDGAGGT